MTQLRSVRIATDPPPVRIAGSFGRLLDVSATGALVQVHRTLAPEREWRMLIDLDPEPVELRVRVVGAKPVAVELPGATWHREEYAVALAFMDLPLTALEALRKLCGDAFGGEEYFGGEE